MGGIKSKALRPFKGYNFENRAQKLIQKQKETAVPKAAPKHASTMEKLEKHAAAHPEIMQDLKCKDDDLVSRMNRIKIESTGQNPQVLSSTRKLPERRTKVGEPELAFEEPDRVPEGKASITQLTEFINEHYTNKEQCTAKHIASDYKLDSAIVEQVLKHFHPLQLKFSLSEQFQKDHKKLTKELKRQGYFPDKPEVTTPEIDTKKLKLGSGKS